MDLVQAIVKILVNMTKTEPWAYIGPIITGLTLLTIRKGSLVEIGRELLG
jgi:hypothetical protein